MTAAGHEVVVLTRRPEREREIGWDGRTPGPWAEAIITVPELSWTRFEAASDVVQVGQRVSGEFLQFDTWNLEARMSLRATRPDPFQTFADRTAVGQELRGRITKLVPFGVFVQVADGIEGLVHLRELTPEPVEYPSDAVQSGDEITVVVAAIDREQRRLTLSRRQGPPAHR